VHNSLAITLPEGAVEASAVVLRQIVPDEGLATVLVHTLKNLIMSITHSLLPESVTYFVSRSVSETGEERKESTRDRGAGCVSEDNLVQVRCGFNLVKMLM
jgi:hypothetical protein